VKRILVIDDNELIVYSLRKTFSHCHAEVCVACDDHDILDKISSHSYDLCLIDIQLPDVDGVTIMKHIKNFSPSTKIAVMSVPPISADSKTFVKTEEIPMIAKPFSLSEMKTLLHGLLDEKPHTL
jgi:CheY-like chemotaxis protein